MKLTHDGAAGTIGDDLARHFGRQVEEILARSSLPTEVEVFAAGTLVPPSEQIEFLTRGVVDFVIDSYTIKQAVPALQVLDLPFLIRGDRHLERVIEAAFRGELSRRFEERGLVRIASLYRGRRHISSRENVIRTPRDLKGVRIRIANSPWMSRTFGNLGATTIALPFSEIRTALEVGVIDAQEGTLDTFRRSRLYEVQRKVSLTGHVCDVAFLIASSERMNSFPRAVREAILEAGRDLERRALELATARDRALIDELRGRGVNFYDVEQELFFDLGRRGFDYFASDVPDGRSVLNTILELAY